MQRSDDVLPTLVGAAGMAVGAAGGRLSRAFADRVTERFFPKKHLLRQAMRAGRALAVVVAAGVGAAMLLGRRGRRAGA